VFTGKAHLLLRPREEGGGNIPDFMPTLSPDQPNPGTKGHG